MEAQIIDAVLIGGWAWLFCGPLTEANMVFSWLPPLVRLALNGGQKKALESWAVWIYLPVIGCGKCHAFWLASAYFWPENAADWPMFFGLWREIVAAVLTAAFLEKLLR